MAHNNLEDAIHEVQAELRSLSDHARISTADNFAADLFVAVDRLANIVEALVRGADHPMKDGDSLRAE